MLETLEDSMCRGCFRLFGFTLVFGLLLGIKFVCREWFDSMGVVITNVNFRVT